MPDWKPRDRVIVRLPDDSAPRGPRGLGGRAPEVDIHGTVLAVDGHGVSIVLDREVNGAVSCYATHGELRPESPEAITREITGEGESDE